MEIRLIEPVLDTTLDMAYVQANQPNQPSNQPNQPTNLTNQPTNLTNLTNPPTNQPT